MVVGYMYISLSDTSKALQVIEWVKMFLNECVGVVLIKKKCLSIRIF